VIPRPGNEPLRALPIEVRPRPAETVESYLRRLAAANHLRPSYLRRYLAGPPSWAGAIRPDRLAALAGRPLETLRRALRDLDPPPRPAPTYRREHRRRADKPALFAAIRHDAQTEMLSERALAARYRVHPRTIKQALASPIPPPPAGRPSRLDPLQDLINMILRTDPDIPAWQIWEQITDDIAINVSYSSVRDYVTRRRSTRSRRRPINDRVA
jgi:hypothetical protein